MSFLGSPFHVNETYTSNLDVKATSQFPELLGAVVEKW